MNWKDIVIEMLKDHGPRKCAVESIPIELCLIDYDIGITQKAVAGGLPAEAVEDIQLSRRVMRIELERALVQAQQRVDDVDKALNALDPTDRDILDKLYIQPETISISRLSKEMCMAVSTMYRKRDVALRKFTTSMYGCIKAK